jgi:hypothetical protein
MLRLEGYINIAIAIGNLIGILFLLDGIYKLKLGRGPILRKIFIRIVNHENKNTPIVYDGVKPRWKP